jgi:5-deoxy-glucuronate isomerase
MTTTIHTEKVPNFMSPEELLIRPKPGSVEVAVDPARAQWRYLSFACQGIPDGQTVQLGDRELETAIVIIGGGGLEARLPGGMVAMPGRSSVWDALPWALYLPPGQRAEVTARAAAGYKSVVLAIGQAPPAGHDGVATEPVVIKPDTSAIEVRGAGHATRQITHIMKPEFPADRLLCVEVYTPGGNWSGWPPHKHDVDDFPAEAVLEETYFYQMRRPEGWGIQRLYQKDGSRDAFWSVRNGDLVLMPDGYHPFSAAPQYDAYYLNFLAGDRRTMANRDDAELAWVKETFATTPIDPRVPLVTARSTKVLTASSG